jgi:hypothetical protein
LIGKFNRVHSGFTAGDPDAMKIVQEFKVGEFAYLEFKKSRSAAQNRMFHALCRLVADNLDGYSVDEVKDGVKLAVGHCRTVRIPWKGQEVTRKTPRSLTELDGDQFNEFMDRALDYFANVLGVEPQTLSQELQAVAA